MHDLLDTACVVGVAGLGALALAALSSGPAGPGRMAELGPSPVLVALAVAAEVGAGCVAAVLLLPRHEGTRVSSNDLVLAARTQLGDGLRRVRSMIRRSNSS